MDKIQELNEIQKAISAIYNGAQEYRIGNRSFKRPDLALLISEKDKIERQISGSMYFVNIEGR